MISIHCVVSKHIKELEDSITKSCQSNEIKYLRETFFNFINYIANGTYPENKLVFRLIEYELTVDKHKFEVRKRFNKYTLNEPFNERELDLNKFGLTDKYMSNYMLVLYNVETGQTNLYIFSVNLKKTQSLDKTSSYNISVNELSERDVQLAHEEESLNICYDLLCDRAQGHFDVRTYYDIFKNHNNLINKCDHFEKRLIMDSKGIYKAQSRLNDQTDQINELQIKINELHKKMFEIQKQIKEEKIHTDDLIKNYTSTYDLAIEFITFVLKKKSFKMNPNYKFSSGETHNVFDMLKLLKIKLN